MKATAPASTFLAALLCITSTIHGQTAKEPDSRQPDLSKLTDSWPTYNGDYSGRRYSPLTKINTATVKQLPERDFASDGLEAAPDGTLYLTDYEHNAIRRLTPSGKYEIVASDPRMIWPDSMSISGNQLYFTANQLNRQAQYQNGKDLRQKPYVIFRTHIASRALAQSSH